VARKPRRRVYLDDLLDADQVADVLGLRGGGRAVSAYITARKRDGSGDLKWPDFPKPVLPHDGRIVHGKSSYWLRQDIEAWRARHPAIARPAPPP
jgi:predicted DNA-binding transcriptional regulator AlpA